MPHEAATKPQKDVTQTDPASVLLLLAQGNKLFTTGPRTTAHQNAPGWAGIRGRYPRWYPRNQAFAGWLPAHGYQAGYQRKRTFLDGLTALVDGPVDGETALFGEHVTAAVTPAVTAKAYFAGRCARMRCAVWCALKAACEPVKTLHIERYALGWYASWYARNRGCWRGFALADTRPAN